MLKFLVERRRGKRINPWTIARPMAAWLSALAQLLDALAGELDEPRWAELAIVIDEAADKIRQLG